MNEADRLATGQRIERYRALSSCQVSDALGKLGLSRSGMRDIRCLDLGAKIVGPAFTVSFQPVDAKPTGIEYIGQVPPGSVIVLAHGGRTDCSVWGGQRTIGAQQRGAAGTVVDGAYRDIPEHIALGYVVFGSAQTVVGSGGHVVPVAIDQTVEIGGVSVAPGDLVIGDGSGVVAVGREHIDDVLRVAEETAAEEMRISAAVADGIDFASFRATVRSGG